MNSSKIKTLLVLALTITSLSILSCQESNIAASLQSLSNHYKKENRLELAQKYYDLAIKEGSSTAIFMQGCQEVKNDNLERAKLLFSQAASMDNFLANMALEVISDNVEDACNTFNKYRASINNNMQSDNLEQEWLDENDAWTFISYIYFEMGKYPLAIKYYKEAIAQHNAKTEYSYLARIYKKQKKYNQAEKYYKLAIASSEKYYLTSSLGKIYYKQGKIDLAKEFYLSQPPENSSIDAHLWLALIYYSEGNIDLAKSHLAQLYIPATELTNPIEVKKYAKKQLSLQSESHNLKEVGLTLYEAKRYEEALPYLLKSLKIRKISTTLDGNYSLIWVGKIYRKLGKLDSSEQIYKKIENEYRIDSYWGLAKIYEQRKNYSIAIKYYRMMLDEINFFNSHAKALSNIIKIYSEHNKTEQVNHYLHQFLDCADYIYLFKLGNHFYSNKNFNLAEKLFKKSVEKQETEGSLINLGLSYTSQEKHAQAIGTFLQALKYKNTNFIKDFLNLYASKLSSSELINIYRILAEIEQDSSSYYNLAYWLEKTNQVNEAKENYAISAKMGNLCAQGKIHQLEGSLEKAESCYKEALEQKRFNAYYLLHLLYKNTGKANLAQHALEMANKHGVIY